MCVCVCVCVGGGGGGRGVGMMEIKKTVFEIMTATKKMTLKG